MNKLLKFKKESCRDNIIINNDGTIKLIYKERDGYKILIDLNLSYLDNFYLLKNTLKYIKKIHNLNVVNFFLYDRIYGNEKTTYIKEKMYLERKMYIESKLRERELRAKLAVKETKPRKKI